MLTKLTFRVGFIMHFFVISFVSCVLSVLSETNPFMDSEWFDINWSGPKTLQQRQSWGDGTTVVMTSDKNEQYSCFVPTLGNSDDDNMESYGGSSAKELIHSLHGDSACSYRIESFWTYELCHGRHLKQYHGDKDVNKEEGKMLFYLGKYQPPPPHPSTRDHNAPTEPKPRPPIKKLENIGLPYYKEHMTDGTLCELTGKPREVSILYVCQPDGRGEIYQIKEMATCQYEVVVLTSVLCIHPFYKPQRPTVNKIQCSGLNGAPVQPTKYLEYFPQAEPQVS